MNIDWSAILQVVGAAYLIVSALALFCTAVSAALAPVSVEASTFFATVAKICGTVAAGLHTIVPGNQTVRKMAGPATLALLAVSLSLESGCAAKNAICPVIDAASQVCPYVTVLFADGSQVSMPKDRAIRAGLQYREEMLGVRK